jgi:hypothetical protein
MTGVSTPPSTYVAAPLLVQWDPRLLDNRAAATVPSGTGHFLRFQCPGFILKNLIDFHSLVYFILESAQILASLHISPGPEEEKHQSIQFQFEILHLLPFVMRQVLAVGMTAQHTPPFDMATLLPAQWDHGLLDDAAPHPAWRGTSPHSAVYGSVDELTSQLLSVVDEPMCWDRELVERRQFRLWLTGRRRLPEPRVLSARTH